NLGVSLMKLGYNLALEQVQKLIMTPELRQAIQLLQFNCQELNEYIKKEIEENPMLEPINLEIEYENIEDYHSKKDEIDWKEFIEKYDDISYKPEVDKNEKEYNYENFVSTSSSLKEYLLFQLNVLKLNTIDYIIGRAIIENIDDNGYLMVTVEQLSEEIGVSPERIENVLSIVQTFDPSGVGARDLKECLLIQVKEDNVKNPNVELIIKKYLKDIAYNRISKIAKELNIDEKEVQDICDYIKTLEPKPGRLYENSSGDVKYIIPDAI